MLREPGACELWKAFLPRAILNSIVPQRNFHRRLDGKLVRQGHTNDLQKSREYNTKIQKHENKTTVVSSIQKTMKKHIGRMQKQFDEKNKNITVENTTVRDSLIAWSGLLRSRFRVLFTLGILDADRTYPGQCWLVDPWSKCRWKMSRMQYKIKFWKRFLKNEVQLENELVIICI